MAGSSGVGTWFLPPLVADRSRMISAPQATIASALSYSGVPSGPMPARASRASAQKNGLVPLRRSIAYTSTSVRPVASSAMLEYRVVLPPPVAATMKVCQAPPSS
jgi:hypothetical protein